MGEKLWKSNRHWLLFYKKFHTQRFKNISFSIVSNLIVHQHQLKPSFIYSNEVSNYNDIFLYPCSFFKVESFRLYTCMLLGGKHNIKIKATWMRNNQTVGWYVDVLSSRFLYASFFHVILPVAFPVAFYILFIFSVNFQGKKWMLSALKTQATCIVHMMQVISVFNSFIIIFIHLPLFWIV